MTCQLPSVVTFTSKFSLPHYCEAFDISLSLLSSFLSFTQVSPFSFFFISQVFPDTHNYYFQILKTLFLIGESLLYNIVLVSAMHQHELAIGILVSHRYISFHLPAHPTPLGCHWAPGLSSLCHTANSHCLSILCIVMYMSQSYFLYSSYQDSAVLTSAHR